MEAHGVTLLLPEKLLRVHHANGRIWLSVPRDNENPNPLNSVDFSPELARQLLYCVRDYRGTFLEQIRNVMVVGLGHLSFQVPKLSTQERSVEIPPRITAALHEAARDYPSGLCDQLRTAISLAGEIDAGKDLPNLANFAVTTTST